ncbi:MAG: hypothetical protein ABSE93_01500 [Terriglobia bacterium]
MNYAKTRKQNPHPAPGERGTSPSSQSEADRRYAPARGASAKGKEAVEMKITSNDREAANRAEITAILIRIGYRVYRPEADCYGEDLMLRTPNGKIRAVQLKSRPTVDWKKYGMKSLWMLFPDTKGSGGRKWFLIPHDKFYRWIKSMYGHGKGFKEHKARNFSYISQKLAIFLHRFAVT